MINETYYKEMIEKLDRSGFVRKNVHLWKRDINMLGHARADTTTVFRNKKTEKYTVRLKFFSVYGKLFHEDVYHDLSELDILIMIEGKIL